MGETMVKIVRGYYTPRKPHKKRHLKKWYKKGPVFNATLPGEIHQITINMEFTLDEKPES
jgi:hypothetical protein